MRYIVIIVLLLTCAGCRGWAEFARSNAEWAEARDMKSCVAASGGLQPYGYGNLVFGTGGTKVETCAKIFGLPGAALLDE